MPPKPPRYGIYRWSHVRDTGRLVQFRCLGCQRRMFYDPNDLIAVYGDHDIAVLPFRCSRCGDREAIDVTMYYPEAGDYGHLSIRRPGKVRKIQTWVTVKLGDKPT